VLDCALASILCVLDLLVSWDRGAGGSVGAAVVVTYAAAGYAVLALRRRHPLAVFAVLLAHSVLGAVLVTAYLPTLGLWLALYTVAAHCGLRPALLAALTTTIPMMINVRDVVQNQPPGQRPAAVLGATAALALIESVLFGVGRWARWTIRQREIVAARAAADAIAEERTQIARDLHDVVAHSVTLMVLQAAGANQLLRTDPDRAGAALEHVDALGQQAIVELREMLEVLRPDLGTAGQVRTGHPTSVSELDALVQQVASGGLPLVYRSVGQAGEVPPAVATALCRIAREALTNASRYGRSGSTVLVELRWLEDGVDLVVRNEVCRQRRATGGRLSAGYGVIGMRERARAAGGTLTAGPLAEDRYEVHASLPVRAMAMAGEG